MKKISNYLPLVLILILGLILRTIFITTVPPALNIDEAALGYNAYSLLKTGADEHGRQLPLVLESFGDWKLPIYSYIATIPIAVLGLSELSTRIPSITAGTISIIIIYFISMQLFGKRGVALFAALFFALSPWSIYFSRAAYEVNVATAFFLGGLLVFLLSLKQAKNRVLLVASGVLFGITIFTYHSYIVFTPLFAASLITLNFKKLKWRSVYLVLPLALLLLLSYFVNAQGGISKASTTTIFTNENIIYSRAENFRKDTLSNPVIFDRIYTKYAGVPYQILQNYLNSFSPTFLFDRGGEKLVHNLDGFGNIYLFDALLLIVGFASLFFYREKKLPLLIYWLILAPIPSSITLDSPNSTRLFILMPLFTLISAYGAYTIVVTLLEKPMGKILVVILSALFLINVLFFLNLYFIHFNYHRALFWRYGYKEVVQLSNKYPDKKVVIRGPYDFIYVYYLFYNKVNPLEFQKYVKYYPVEKDGFRYVESFGKYKFVKELRDEKESSDTLYFDNQNFNMGDKVIKLPNGDPVFKYYVGKD